MRHGSFPRLSVVDIDEERRWVPECAIHDAAVAPHRKAIPGSRGAVAPTRYFAAAAAASG